MLYTDRQYVPPTMVTDMPLRELTADETAFVERAVDAVKHRKTETPPKGLSEKELFFWQVNKDIQSPEGMAVLNEQIGQDLIKIAHGEKVDIKPPSAPSKKSSLLSRLFTCITP